jgi:Asp-tRNA(Asn)/Glu-tRNA(Gln) amidotransferase A subunit family amidase
VGQYALDPLEQRCSARGGQTRNPYALDRNPSGSSSGAGAAAASLATLTIGTEADGAIVSPAATCGIVGIKPTLGLVSRSGISDRALPGQRRLFRLRSA